MTQGITECFKFFVCPVSAGALRMRWKRMKWAARHFSSHQLEPNENGITWKRESLPLSDYKAVWEMLRRCRCDLEATFKKMQNGCKTVALVAKEMQKRCKMDTNWFQSKDCHFVRFSASKNYNLVFLPTPLCISSVSRVLYFPVRVYVPCEFNMDESHLCLTQSKEKFTHLISFYSRFFNTFFLWLFIVLEFNGILWARNWTFRAIFCHKHFQQIH